MKTVLITGVSSGIGLATFNKFLSEGYYVIGTQRKLKDIELDPALLQSQNYKLIEMELTDSNSIKSAVTEISKLSLPIDILINNAGVLLDSETDTISINALRITLEVNLVGLIDFTEQLLPKLVAQATIVNLGSSLGNVLEANKHFPSYRISKAGVHMYSRALADRLESTGSKVYCVSPGWVKSHVGGTSAPREPQDAALDIFNLTLQNNIPSGEFVQFGDKRTS